MRYLLFGESIAFGETDYENGGWAGNLKKYLDAEEKHCFFHNLAISGDTSRDLLKRVETEAKVRIRDKPKEEWTMFIFIGTNDSRIEDGKPKVSEEEYKDNVIKILKVAKELVGKVIAIGSVPVIESVCNPWGDKDCIFLNERLKKYSQMMKECAEKEGISFIEIFSKLESRDDLDKLYDDGLHANREGHLVIFEEIKNALEK